MINENSFKLNEEIDLPVYNYDDQGNEYISQAKGKVKQITKYFVVVDNGKYTETFLYCTFNKIKDRAFLGIPDPYDQDINRYREDILKNAKEDFEKDGKAVLFNKKQLEDFVSKLENCAYTTKKVDNFYFINKI